MYCERQGMWEPKFCLYKGALFLKWRQTFKTPKTNVFFAAKIF